MTFHCLTMCKKERKSKMGHGTRLKFKVEISPWFLFKSTGWGKSRFTVVSAGSGVYCCSIIYCIVFHLNNCTPTFAPPGVFNIHSSGES